MNFSSNKAIYIQIADLICEKILLREFKQDERIPSVRELAIDLEVNPNTVMRTYEYLQSLDIITNKRGVGFYVSNEGVKKATDYRKAEFMEQELPGLLKTMALLKIELSELNALFQTYHQNTKKSNP
ncbi:MAG: GntR family transcriptional regulator [Sphingobacteriia bacterium]|nr:MAG: GntR family transcriptional regulator [Sphingobacteriia bacterium]